MKTMAIATALTALVAAQDNGDAIRDRLDKYLLDYEPQLSSVVADERMTQRDGASRYANPKPPSRPRTGRSFPKSRSSGCPAMQAGLASAASSLSTARRSRTRPVAGGAPDGRRLGRLRPGAPAAYRKARGTISGAPRTTNLPNLPLEFLHPRNRHRLHHRLDGMEKIRGINTARMVFEEHSTPTMIQRPEGGDMQSLISAWIEPDTGRLLRAQVKTRDARIGVLPFDQSIAVEFRADEKLGMLVPYEMKEEFFAGRFREGTGTARYSNYRQFRTAARIVPPPP